MYFLRIAESGYEFEHFHAFFPLLPFMMRLVANTVASPLIPVIGHRNVLIISGLLICNAAFIASVVVMFRLSRIVLRNEVQAYRTALLYCITPASIFMSAIYTESPFALFSLLGLLSHFQGHDWQASLWFCLASSTRSNGSLFVGVFIFSVMHRLFDRRLRVTKCGELLKATLHSLITVAPLIANQMFVFIRYCTDDPTRNQFEYCSQTIPNPYGCIQSKYWNVGFLRYFELKQIPNFLLASPILTLSVCAIVSFAKRNPLFFFTLGFRRDGTQSQPQTQVREGRTTRKEGGFYNPNLDNLVLLYYLCAVTMLLVTSAHIQISTRFLASCPPIFWFCSTFVFEDAEERVKHTQQQRQRQRHNHTTDTAGRLVLGYFLSYAFVGTVLFSNFYPWT